MTKSELIYNLKCSGLSWSQVAERTETPAKVCPTLAKGHMNSHKLPHWNTVTAQHEVLTAAEPSFEEIDPTVELRKGLSYLADHARAAGDTEKESAFVKALSFLI
jgi:hypothetical protein